MSKNLLGKNLIDFIHKCPTMFHTISVVEEQLHSSGFIKLENNKAWNLRKEGKYYVTSNDSALVAFVINSTSIENDGFKMVAAHTDSPGFKVKPQPEMKKKNYLSLNTEVYGSPIMSSWFDIPLSIAGRVSYKGDNLLKPKSKLINIETPIAIIPNLAIHMNRKVNTGMEFNAQKDTLPITKILNSQLQDDYLKTLIAKESNIAFDKILDTELYLYPYTKGSLIGINNEMLSSPRLDNLAMVYTGIKALRNTNNTKGINMMVCFDNEEVGSRTKQGADSPFLSSTLERITIALGKTKEEYFRAINESFLISSDMAHAYHPNYPDKQDPTNTVLLSKGPVIKYSASQSYTTDSDSSSVFRGLCEKADVPCQSFANRSDEGGGSTIGPVSTSHVPVRSLDIGAPMLSMHSAFELMAVKDISYTLSVFRTFFEA